MCANLQSDQSAVREDYIPVRNGKLYYREIGLNAKQNRQPIVILHGGIDLDHTYLLPDLDRLSDSYRLIYYDQRGRGKSPGDVQDINIESEMEDLDALRRYFHLEKIALLGHSWGGLLALEYAVRHPDRVSHLILMHTAPVSHDGFALYAEEWRRRRVPYEEELKALRESASYQEGDPKALADYYRIYFSTTIKKPEDVVRVNLSLKGFTKDSVLRGRAIEERLANETWSSSEYNLLPELEKLNIPTLVIHGDYDFIPVAVSSAIAEAMPESHFVLLEDCGHFSYIEHPDELHKAIDNFFTST